MITSTLVMPVIAITTLCTIIYIGLGFLPRPSRATLLWSVAFTVAMVGAYIWLAHELFASEQFRALGSALAIAPISLLWSGLRAYRGRRRDYSWIAIASLILIPLLLLGSTFIGVYGVAFRVMYSVAAVFALLLVWELSKLGPQLSDESIPLMAVSGVFVVFAAISIVNGVLLATGDLNPADSLAFVRTMNLIGMTVFTVCSLITTLLLTIRGGDAPASSRGSFEHSARNRLDRARAGSEQWWSMLDIRLDDTDDIRTASSTAAFNAVTQVFAQDIDSVFPADSDINRVSATRYTVLVPRPQGGVRELLTELLERVSASDANPAYAIRVSASIGWAPVSAVGYDYDTLSARAAAAAQTAQAAGGDRWERVRVEAE